MTGSALRDGLRAWVARLGVKLAPRAGRRSASGSTGAVARPATLDISVVLCTCDPTPSLLRAALCSLARQTLPRSAWELVVVDNRSQSPLTDDIFEGLDLPACTMLHEPRSGLLFARQTAYLAARGAILVCLDDDNELADDYLARALSIAAEQPTLGVWGGVSVPAFAAPPLTWTRPLLEHLAIRDYGDKVITSYRQEWGPWDPIGAGMVLRRAVAFEYVGFTQAVQPELLLGRTSTRLLGGEDTLLNRLANRLGLACSYQPTLRLTHHIKAHRLTPRYLRQLLYAQGVTQARLACLLGTGPPPIAPERCRALLRERWLQRRRELGRCGPIQWRWDLGHALETLRLQGTPGANR
jgi:hypothetical protein